MSQTQCEQILSRVLAYLSSLGMPVTREVSMAALRLVEEALSQEDFPDLYAWVMARLPQQFALPQLELPPLAPPINRGSIGYGDA
ncbi:MAG: hypothetical protein HPY82_21440 [Gammaproteobacteria bacterium]|nr:hypothetical protein [Gammaproteobacteria bacterium]